MLMKEIGGLKIVIHRFNSRHLIVKNICFTIPIELYNSHFNNIYLSLIGSLNSKVLPLNHNDENKH